LIQSELNEAEAKSRRTGKPARRFKIQKKNALNYLEERAHFRKIQKLFLFPGRGWGGGGVKKRIEAMSSSNDLRLEYWPLDRLIPSARNARTHSSAQVAEIAGSIRAFGFSNPILVGADGDIIAGHGRLAAARQLGRPKCQ
jgi:ParB/Sulfiredoxin domain